MIDLYKTHTKHSFYNEEIQQNDQNHCPIAIWEDDGGI